MPYVAVYRIREQTLEVLRVYHTARNLSWSLLAGRSWPIPTRPLWDNEQTKEHCPASPHPTRRHL